jgi:hypothetical protein
MIEQRRRRAVDRRTSLGRRMHSERRRRQVMTDAEHREHEDRRGRMDRRLGNRAAMSYWFLSWLRGRDDEA